MEMRREKKYILHVLAGALVSTNPLHQVFNKGGSEEARKQLMRDAE